MKIHTFAIGVLRGDIIGYGSTAKEAEDMCRKAYNEMTSQWDEDHAPRNWGKAKEYYGTSHVELELPCATQDNELIIQKGKIIQ